MNVHRSLEAAAGKLGSYFWMACLCNCVLLTFAAADESEKDFSGNNEVPNRKEGRKEGMQ